MSPAASVAMLDLQPEQSPVHVISLADGSRFSGLLLNDALELALVRGPKVAIPVAGIRRLAFAPEPDDASEPAATLRLTGEDTLVVNLAPKITVATTYANVTINGPEVKRIGRVKDAPEDLQFSLWDDSVISGRPLSHTWNAPWRAAPRRACRSAQLSPISASPRSRRPVRWNRSSSWLASSTLMTGSSASGPNRSSLPWEMPSCRSLKQLRADQPPEAQERIDSILKQFTKSEQQARRSRGRTSMPSCISDGFVCQTI